MDMNPDISRDQIESTAARIAPFIRRTPVVEAMVPGIEFPVTFKLEQLQHTGSFKARGAFASIVGAKIPAAGIAAASGGNHGAAVAFTARHFGIKARIFVPSSAPKAKVDRIHAYGAEIEQPGTLYQHALDACLAYCKSTGALNMHAFDQVPVILGQGTLGREIGQQCPDIDTLLVAAGGGGLIGGIAAWFQGRVNVICVEPAGSPTLHAALAAGRLVTIAPNSVAQDSLGASSAGALIFPIVQAFVQQSVLVTEDSIIQAMRWLWSDLQLAVEPGGATALAALLSGAYMPQKGEKVAVLVCGANVDLTRFAEWTAN
jgi:threonine dehydratase